MSQITFSLLLQGVDLTKSTTAMLASQAHPEDLGSSSDLTTLVTALPSQGALRPGEKRVIHFRFSPRYTKSNKGWRNSDQPPPRRDYALFMHIETVGSVAGVTEKTKMGNGSGGILVEVLFNSNPFTAKLIIQILLTIQEQMYE